MHSEDIERRINIAIKELEITEKNKESFIIKNDDLEVAENELINKFCEIMKK